MFQLNFEFGPVSTKLPNHSEPLLIGQQGSYTASDESSFQPSFSNFEPDLEPVSIVDSISNDKMDVLKQCDILKSKFFKNSMCCYINIKSIRNKIHELKPIITKLQPVLFTVAETKLDNSFNDSQFAVTNYRIFRQDGSPSSSGGLLSYVRCDIPCRRVPTLETKVVGMIAVELRIKNTNLNGWSYKHTNLPALVIFQCKMILNLLWNKELLYVTMFYYRVI